MGILTRASTATVLAMALALGTSGCSSSGGGGEPAAQTPPANNLATTATFTSGAPLMLSAGVPSTGAIFVDLPADFDLGQLVEAAVDLTETLALLSITRTDGGATPNPTIEFELLVSDGDERNISCSGGTQALRAEIVGNTDFSSKTVSVDEAAMSQAALDVANSGAFTLCASAMSSVDANVTLSGLALAFGFDGNCTAPEGLAGVWTGDYTCGPCPGAIGDEPDTVEITITQAGETAIYQDDSGATYVGNVCGSSFHHLGLGSGYIEYGTFTRVHATGAIKSSTWVSTTGLDGGCCADTLTFSSN